MQADARVDSPYRAREATGRTHLRALGGTTQRFLLDIEIRAVSTRRMSVPQARHTPRGGWVRSVRAAGWKCSLPGPHAPETMASLPLRGDARGSDVHGNDDHGGHGGGHD